MYKRTVEYEDYSGNKRREDFYFHLNKAEVIQWLICNGGYTLDQQLQRLYEASRGKDIMDIFEDLLRRSYGKKSLDGRRFDKDDEIWKDFRATEAYSIIFTDLVTDAKKAAAFINAIIPKRLQDDVNKVMEENRDAIPDELRDYVITDILDENGELTTVSEVSQSSNGETAQIVSMPNPLPSL